MTYHLADLSRYLSDVTQIKARTHTLTLGGSAFKSVVESANYKAESADSTTDFAIISRLFISNMFNILNPLELADLPSTDYWSRPTANQPSGYRP